MRNTAFFKKAPLTAGGKKKFTGQENTIKSLKSLSEKVIDALENSQAPFRYFVLTFLFAAALRNFLEIFSDEYCPITPDNFLHYDLSYVALAVLLSLLLYKAVKIPVAKILRVVLPSFMILNLPPLIDLLLSSGQGYDIAYLSPETHGSLLLRFLTFFGPFGEKGISPGIKIEVALVLVGVFFYIYLKTSRLLRSFVYTLLTYVVIFFYLSFPYIIKAVMGLMGLEFLHANMQFISFYLSVIFVAGIFLAYAADRELFMLILKDIRPFRLSHYLLMYILGLALASQYQPVMPAQYNPFDLFFIPVAITFAWLFSVITNNLVDYDIDRVSNRDRPLTSGKIAAAPYKKIAWVLFFLALLYSGTAHFRAFFFIGLFIGNYFLYSMPPLRLKRIPFFSKLFISLNSLLLVLLGFMTVTGAIDDFPKALIAYFLIFFTAAINFIDIKDYEGDKRAGIKTLPVLLGEKKSRLLIGGFFFLAHVSLYVTAQHRLLIIPLLIFGGLQFGLINRKKYDEKIVFSFYLLSLLLIILYVVIFKVKI
ncbi:MAG: UbiA family prenyltransferase [Candidatus Aminicenantes bacterium]|nr:UbiA family prenyltransferase [Candidatus Aminicenantes bacterium]